MKNNITFKKLILLFSAVIVPFFLLSLFLLLQNRSATRNRTFNIIQEKTNLTAQTLTDSIEQIYHTATEVAGQVTLQKLSNSAYPMAPYEAAKDILKLREQQISIKNANPYIENFVIYYENRLEAYNGSNGRPSFFEFTPEEYQAMENSRTAFDFLTLYNHKLTEVILPSSGSGFFIRIDISSQTMYSLLKDCFPEYEPYFLLDAFDSSYQLTNFSDEQLAQALGDNHLRTVLIDKENFYHFSQAVPYGNLQIHFFFSQDKLFADTQLYPYLYLCFAIFILFACCFFLLGSYIIIHKPIQTLIKGFEDITNQNYSVRILNKQNSDFSYLYHEFNKMAKQLGILIEKNYHQQLLLNKAELKQLQAQINPHFLYNSFLLLRRMIQDELYEEAQKMADTLGLYFKYITRNRQEYMPLSQEYHHALLYCEIQQMRFEGRIRINADPLPPKYADMPVPKLIIQPILENAFNYGLHDKADNGLLQITICDNASELMIAIEDNGEDLSDEHLEEIINNLKSAVTGDPLQEMTGILNIQRRLVIYSDGCGCLKACRSPLGGLCIQLILPVNQVPEKENKHL